MCCQSEHWTWVWVNSRSWWWTGKPGALESMGVTESDMTEWLNWTKLNWAISVTQFSWVSLMHTGGIHVMKLLLIFIFLLIFFIKGSGGRNVLIQELEGKASLQHLIKMLPQKYYSLTHFLHPECTASSLKSHHLLTGHVKPSPKSSPHLYSLILHLFL